MPKISKVYLTGGDGVGWALDECLHHTKEALGGIVEFTGLRRCNVVHSLWLMDIVSIPWWRLIGKKVICDMPGMPWRFFMPEMYKKYGRAFNVTDYFLPHNDRDKRWLEQKGFPHLLRSLCS